MSFTRAIQAGNLRPHRRGTRSRSLFPANPRTVFGARLLYWSDPSDLSAQWVDIARTTPAASTGALVGSWMDKAGTLGTWYMQQAVSNSKVILRQDASGRWYREYDGLDDGGVSSATLNFSAYSAVTVLSAIRKRSDAALARWIEFSANSTTNNGAFVSNVPQGATASYGGAVRGTTSVSGSTPATFAAPNLAVLTNFFDLNQTTRDASMPIRVNGVDQVLSGGTTGNPGPPPFGTYNLYQGRRNDATAPTAVDEYQALIVAGVLAGAELTWAEQFCARACGASF